MLKILFLKMGLGGMELCGWGGWNIEIKGFRRYKKVIYTVSVLVIEKE